MSDITEDEKKHGINYLTYKGLGYTPMLGGVPLFAALGMLGGLVLALVCLLAGVPMLGLAVVMIDLTAYLFLKVICENNNKAPTLFKLKFKGLIARIGHGHIIKVDIGADSHERQKKLRQQFKSLFATGQ